jgi:hypothetical protein
MCKFSPFCFVRHPVEGRGPAFDCTDETKLGPGLRRGDGIKPNSVDKNHPPTDDLTGSFAATYVTIAAMNKKTPASQKPMPGRGETRVGSMPQAKMNEKRKGPMILASAMIDVVAPCILP